jgi:hypothetical protein
MGHLAKGLGRERLDEISENACGLVSEKSIRNLAVLPTLHETAARVQEIIDLDPLILKSQK